MFENPNLFVISGVPGSGKTTVLQELAKLVARAKSILERIPFAV
jgi:adenylate kinase